MRVDSNDIFGLLNVYIDYCLQEIKKPFKGLKQVALINNAFDDTLYFIDEKSDKKILYFMKV